MLGIKNFNFGLGIIDSSNLRILGFTVPSYLNGVDMLTSAYAERTERSLAVGAIFCKS